MHVQVDPARFRWDRFGEVFADADGGGGEGRSGLLLTKVEYDCVGKMRNDDDGGLIEGAGEIKSGNSQDGKPNVSYPFAFALLDSTNGGVSHHGW